MNTLHETQISKTRKIAGYTLSVIPSLMILMAGIMKVIGNAEMLENMSKITNWGDKMLLIGLIELSALTLYWIPKTSNIGFFLLASFGGGIIVAEVVGGNFPLPGIMVASLFYVGTMLRKPSLSGMNL
tara:strand:- start:1926 stop:2309 length:384 start_codon:yes stop_codon:yes gene_type:complete